MKILWLSHLTPYPPKGGVLQRSYYLMREIAKGNHLDVVCFVQKDLFSHIYPNMETALRENTEALRKFCNEIHYLDIPCESTKFGKYNLALKSLVTTEPFTINWLKSKQADEFFDRMPNKSSYDIVHYDTISLAPYMKHFHNKSVLNHHNIESHMMFRRIPEENNFFKKGYFYQEAIKLRHYEKQVYPEFDLHITCSNLDSTRLTQIVPNINVQSVPNGADTEYLYPDESIRKEPNSVIFVGGLDYYPTTQAIMFFAQKIWPLLKIKIPEIQFHLVGRNPPQFLKDIANEDPDFHIYGFVDDIRKYMNLSRVYVCPITDGGGTKLKILDALAMAMPIVANPIACEGIDVTDGTNVIFAETAEDYVEAIYNLLSNPSKCNEIGNNARDLIINKYSVEIIGKNMRRLYENLLC